METVNSIFRKYEVIGDTKDAAKDSVKDLTLMVDATQAFNKWAEKNVTSEDNIKDWMKDYLRKKKYDKAGIGAYIVTQTAVTDNRERPYKVVKEKHESRTHTPEKFYVLRDATGHEVGREKTSKAAEQAAKEFIMDFKEDITINYEWVAKEKNSLYAKVLYTPSKGTRPCKMTVFGWVNAE